MDTADAREEPERLEEPPKRGPPARADDDGEERTATSGLNPADPENQPIPGENPGDDVLPISPGRRRLGMYIGMLFILVILIFLVWFAATHTEQAEPGSIMGRLPPDAPSLTVA